ncbi:hypothetical protein LJE86_07395 [bacterium BMS3Abin03]|nr:hypothetical protein [bacterium BMS3Abin03]MCG6958773.1 hypothetical protein [bacterium BMS3Abin03]
MKNLYFALIILLFVSFNNVQAQTFNKKSAFISGLVGAASLNNSGVSDHNSFALTFGGSFGIPLTKNLFLYTRSSYTSKSNFQSYYNESFVTSQFQYSDRLALVNASFSQLVINSGLLYNFYVSKFLTLGVSGGATFAVLNQDAKMVGGHVISNVDNEAIWGAFGGLMVEKGWEESNITTFAEAQYNYAQSDAAYHSNALNRMNFTIGVRYYLDRRGF